MPRQVRHEFATATEANAFVAGVEWVNDSAIEVIDIEIGDTAIVVCNDDEGGDEDITITYIEEVHT